jgi:hypothetical protein
MIQTESDLTLSTRNKFRDSGPLPLVCKAKKQSHDNFFMIAPSLRAQFVIRFTLTTISDSSETLRLALPVLVPSFDSMGLLCVLPELFTFYSKLCARVMYQKLFIQLNYFGYNGHIFKKC